MFKRICRFVYLSIAVTLFSACSSGSHNTPLRVGTHKWIGYETFSVADKLGYYKDDNLRLVRLSSASDQMHAIRSENLEAATLTLDETLTLISEGFDLSVVLIIDYSDGGDGVVIKPDIENLEALRGKKIAVEYSAVGAIMLNALFDASGLTEKDVTLVPCTVAEHIGCYADVDAVVTYEPTLTKLASKGAKLALTSKTIPNAIVDVLVVNKKLADGYDTEIKKLINGYMKARDLIETSPNRVAEIVSRRLDITPEQVLASYGLVRIPDLAANIALLSAPSSTFTDDVQNLVTLMMGKGMLSHEVDTQGLVDARYIE